jgi:Do/DeqQ family serine protease
MGVLPATAAPPVARALEEAFAEVAESAFPAVVVITNKRIVRRPLYPELPPEFHFFFGLPHGFEERGGPGGRPPQRGPSAREVPQIAGKGSGVIVGTEGYIVTNYHVIRESDALVVELSDGRVFDSSEGVDQVRIVGVDEDTDLALLQIGNGEIDSLPTLRFADSAQVRVGQWAIAVGAPFDLEYSVTVGVVSQKERHNVGDPKLPYRDYIQTDASINPGNSGGPLLNLDGEMIGINNFIVTGGGMSRGNIGLGFAIAGNLARKVVADLIEHGEVVRPFLGVQLQMLTRELKQVVGVDTGVLVSDAMEGEPAAAAGIRAGDVIVRIGEREVKTPAEVQFAVLDYKPGDKVKVVALRDGKEQTFKVTARRRDNGGSFSRRESGPIRGREELLNRVGLALEAESDTVRIAAVVSASSASEAGLQRGDVILEVNGSEVSTVAAVIEALKRTSGRWASFYIARRRSKFFVAVEIGE